MKIKTIAIIALAFVLILAMPMAVLADNYEENELYNRYELYDEYETYTPQDVEDFMEGVIEMMFFMPDGGMWMINDDGEMFVRLRWLGYSVGAAVFWRADTGEATLSRPCGVSLTLNIEAVGGFIEDGVSWIPESFHWQIMQLFDRPIGRIDTTLWLPERFEDVREASFSTDLEHGEIAVNFIEYMSDNLGKRSAFTYRELEAAVWIVEELLAMGHSFDNIYVQEFTYWEVRDARWAEMDEGGFGGFLGSAHWSTVTSPMILGTDRFYQLRADRVSQNVVLTIPGQSDRFIIVGAHYDSPPYPSASDNASGTALLLESAQRMLEHEQYYTIVYVFFGAEEVGLVGAAHFYRMLSPAQRENIVMMVNADVLIEGPYVIYGAGAFPRVDDEDAENIREAIIEDFNARVLEFRDEQIEWIQEVLDSGDNWFWGMGETAEEIFDSMVEQQIEWIMQSPIDSLIMQAAMMGLIEPYVDAAARRVSEIAAELTYTYDFELISVPQSISGSSDNLIFYYRGYTVVTLWGMERLENIEAISEELTSAHPMAGMPMWEDFVATVLHSPADCFHEIERIWPGMMLNNLRAFSLFLEQILTSRFG